MSERLGHEVVTTGPTKAGANGVGETRNSRDRLFDAAVLAFSKRGFHATTTRDIAQGAGMSPAAVYVHHDSKESLLYLVCLRGHQQGLDTLVAAYESQSEPVERLRRMMHDFTYWHAENSMLAKVAQYEIPALTREHHQEVTTIRRAIEACMQQALQAGIDSGDFDVDDVPGTALALLSLSVDLVRWFVPGGSRSAAELARLNAELALRMVAQRSQRHF